MSCFLDWFRIPCTPRGNANGIYAMYVQSCIRYQKIEMENAGLPSAHLYFIKKMLGSLNIPSIHSHAKYWLQ